MKVDLKDIEFEEPYEVESIKQGKRSSIFAKKEKIEFEALKHESEDTDYLIQMKIRVYNEKINKEESIQTYLLNEQRHNLHRIGVYCLFIVIFSLLIVMLEKWVNLSVYTTISDISIFDMQSVGALFIFPMIILFFIGIVVSFAWIIVLLKRSAFTDDPHDQTRRRREAIIITCDEKIKDYKKEIYRLQMKLLNIK